MCCKNGGTCPQCDPGIEAFYQKKVKEAKEASAYLLTTGVECHYENLLDAKDIWYEYCELRDAEEAEDEVDKQDLPAEIYSLKGSWV